MLRKPSIGIFRRLEVQIRHATCSPKVLTGWVIARCQNWGSGIHITSARAALRFMARGVRPDAYVEVFLDELSRSTDTPLLRATRLYAWQLAVARRSGLAGQLLDSVLEKSPSPGAYCDRIRVALAGEDVEAAKTSIDAYLAGKGMLSRHEAAHLLKTFSTRATAQAALATLAQMIDSGLPAKFVLPLAASAHANQCLTEELLDRIYSSAHLPEDQSSLAVLCRALISESKAVPGFPMEAWATNALDAHLPQQLSTRQYRLLSASEPGLLFPDFVARVAEHDPLLFGGWLPELFPGRYVTRFDRSGNGDGSLTNVSIPLSAALRDRSLVLVDRVSRDVQEMALALPHADFISIRRSPNRRFATIDDIVNQEIPANSSEEASLVRELNSLSLELGKKATELAGMRDVFDEEKCPLSLAIEDHLWKPARISRALISYCSKYNNIVVIFGQNSDHLGYASTLAEISGVTVYIDSGTDNEYRNEYRNEVSTLNANMINMDIHEIPRSIRRCIESLLGEAVSEAAVTELQNVQSRCECLILLTGIPIYRQTVKELSHHWSKKALTVVGDLASIPNQIETKTEDCEFWFQAGVIRNQISTTMTITDEEADLAANILSLSVSRENFRPLYTKRIVNFIKLRLPHIASEAILARSMIEAWQPRYVGLMPTRSPALRSIALHCSKVGYFTFEAQAIFWSRHPRYRKSLADVFGYIAEPELQSYADLSPHVPQSYVRVGALRESLHARGATNKLKGRISTRTGSGRAKALWIGQHMSYESVTFDLIHQLQHISKWCAMTLKLHPSSSSAYVEFVREAVNNSGLDWEVCWKEDTTALIDEADVVMTLFSNVGLEAAAMGKHVIALDTGEQNVPIDLAGLGIAVPMKLGPSLARDVEAFLADKPAQMRLAETREAFFARNPELRSHEGGAIFVREIIRLAEKRVQELVV